MSSVPHRRADTVAGYLCAFSLTLSALALVRHPALLAPAGILIALVAARMTEAHRVLAVWAVALATLAFVFGMLVSIVTDKPLF
jgi:hypothetical protein